jgi:integrase
VSTKTGSFEYDTPKTEAGKRTLPIPPHLVPILVEHLNQYANPEPGALVFATKKGNPAVDAGSKEIKKALTRLGLGHVRTYDLRHTGQTLAAENGASLKELMHRMGHASPNASLNYQHRTQQHGRDIANRLSETATNVIPIRKSKAS